MEELFRYEKLPTIEEFSCLSRSSDVEVVQL